MEFLAFAKVASEACQENLLHAGHLAQAGRRKGVLCVALTFLFCVKPLLLTYN